MLVARRREQVEDCQTSAAYIGVATDIVASLGDREWAAAVRAL